MAGGFERRLEMRREFGLLVWIGKRGRERRDRVVVEMDIGKGSWVPAMDAKLGLAVVYGGANEMDWYFVGQEETGEMEELVEMALHWQWNKDHHNLGLAIPMVSHVDYGAEGFRYVDSFL